MSSDNTRSAFILFAKTVAGKAQAGHFSSAEGERATAAAFKHGASAVVFRDGNNADLLAAIPAGAFGENDQLVLGNIKTETFKRLAAVAEQQAKAATAGQSPEAADEADGAEKAAQPLARGKKAAAMLATTTDKATGETLVSVVVKEGDKHWPALKKGDIVLATDFSEGEYNGWWEAIVIARSDSHVTLEWRDYPDLPTFSLKITQVAPIHPECMVKASA